MSGESTTERNPAPGSSSTTLVIPNLNVQTQREKLERIRVVIQECSLFLARLDSSPRPKPILLEKYFPDNVREVAATFLQLAHTNYSRLRDQVEYENLIWTTQEHVNTELWNKVSGLLENLEKTRPIFLTASSSIFSNIAQPPLSKPIKYLLTMQDKVLEWLTPDRDFDKHPAEVHMSVTVETDGGRPQLSQLRRSTTSLPSGREILDPRTLPRGAEAARSFLQELRERIPADSHIFSHLIAVFDIWMTGSIVNSSFITALATSLESYPELLESFQTASSQMAPPVKLHIAVDTRGKISLVTIISSGKDGLIVPISTDMRRLADEFSSNMTPITSSSGLRSLLGIPDRCREVLMKMDVRWMAAVIPLIQLELTENNAYSRQLHMLLLKLTKTNCSLPASLLLENIEREGANPISGGGFADIWRGRLHGQVVCLKVLRFYMENDRDELFRHLYREVTIWKSLNHRNILPFVGVSLKLFTPSFCMVSPWMNNGHVMSFLNKRPDYNRLTVIYEVAEGVNYLHSLDPPVVHGDIKGSNILVTDDCVCCLADFGLAAVSESHAFSTTSTNPGGTTRWLPPECFLPNQYPDCPKLARDIYSFGCTVLEIISGREPFSQPWLTDVAVMTAVVRGERPQRPEGNPWCTDTLWTLIERCWAQEAVSRPSARHIVDFMREYGNTAQI